MVIREGANFVEIEAVEREPGGDAQYSVSINSSGFSGKECFWLGRDCLEAFLLQLSALEESRRGDAVLEALSPEEFALRICAIDRRGHMAVMGHVVKEVYRGQVKAPYHHSVKFGFEFDPTQLPAVLKGFRNLVRTVTEAAEDS